MSNTSHNTLHPAKLSTDELLKDCCVQRVRRSGPGGQHRNKVETGIVVTHQPSGVRAEASERRSQVENQRKALWRLRLNLALDVRSRQDLDSMPSALWQSRCQAGSIMVNPAHDDFPALLAEALDAVFYCGMEIPAAAEQLGCTVSQLTKFLKKQPRAMLLINKRRHELGLSRWK